MIRSIFGIEKSKKSFGHNFSRRKFFGFAFSAGAAAVVAPAALAEGIKVLIARPEYCPRYASWPLVQPTLRDQLAELAKWEKIMSTPDPMFELIPFKPADDSEHIYLKGYAG